MSRTKRSPTASGHDVLLGFASLRSGLKRWMLANLPTDSGLTVPRAQLLMGLNLLPEPVGMSELGESFGMSPRNMTVLVDGLAKEGLVRRVEHQTDRRVKLVELTPAGRRIAELKLAPAQLATAALFNDLSPRERGEFLRLLGKVAEALRQRGIDVPPVD